MQKAAIELVDAQLELRDLLKALLKDLLLDFRELQLFDHIMKLLRMFLGFLLFVGEQLLEL